MIAALLALSSSISWGSADYLGGAASKRRPAVEVTVCSQAFALVAVWLVLLLTGTPLSAAAVGWGLAAGVSGALALSTFYRALATGTMGVVAPISALGLVIPVVAGLIGGDRPSVVQATGIVVAVLGVVLASGPERAGAAGGRPLALAGMAGVGFGVTLFLLAQSPDTVATLAMMRLSSVAVLLLGLLLTARPGRPRLPRLGRREVPVLAFVGVADLGANGMYAAAAQLGELSVVAVLASLYPAVTVVLAWRLQHERLGQGQVLGVGAALVGVVLLAGG